jgi:hypothetical protein
VKSSNGSDGVDNNYDRVGATTFGKSGLSIFDRRHHLHLGNASGSPTVDEAALAAQPARYVKPTTGASREQSPLVDEGSRALFAPLRTTSSAVSPSCTIRRADIGGVQIVDSIREWSSSVSFAEEAEKIFNLALPSRSSRLRHLRFLTTLHFNSFARESAPLAVDNLDRLPKIRYTKKLSASGKLEDPHDP